MARIDMETDGIGGTNTANNPELLCELGLMHATGRDCELDLVSAHKWLNIAAVKGSARAVALRNEIAATMSKAELAQALRAAREWMTMH